MFLQRYAAKFNKHIEDIDPDALLTLRQAEWKGNVRELRNVIERSVIICDNQITLEDLPIELQHHPCSRSDDKGMSLNWQLLNESIFSKYSNIPMETRQKQLVY